MFPDKRYSMYSNFKEIIIKLPSKKIIKYSVRNLVTIINLVKRFDLLLQKRTSLVPNSKDVTHVKENRDTLLIINKTTYCHRLVSSGKAQHDNYR